MVLNAPDGYENTLEPLPDGVVVLNELAPESYFVQFFTTKVAELVAEFPRLRDALTQDGMLWVSWPKGTAKVKTDLNENTIRDIGLDCGLVDVKLCAVDHTWSGLKFVRRLKDRK